MKRLHVSLSVEQLDNSVKFYSTLFGSEPTLLKDDYAQWILDDPSVNFSISARGGKSGFNHVGIQAETEEELQELYGRVHQTDGVLIEQGQTVCCYAESNKNWVIARRTSAGKSSTPPAVPTTSAPRRWASSQTQAAAAERQRPPRRCIRSTMSAVNAGAPYCPGAGSFFVSVHGSGSGSFSARSGLLANKRHAEKCA